MKTCDHCERAIDFSDDRRVHADDGLLFCSMNHAQLYRMKQMREQARFDTEERTCLQCGKDTTGRGYRIGEDAFCCWPHALAHHA